MRKALCFLVLLAAAVSAVAQISVTIDGRAVDFQGAPPQQVNGRVLVPLRGVLEAMGAYVEFEAATNGIIANRGATQITMRIGERAATVNGRTVMLDVPAMTLRGRTMVPLRFIGEALGADVKWNDASQMVSIITSDVGAGGGNQGGGNQGGGNQGGGNQGGTVDITGLDVSSMTEWLKPGDKLDVVLRGTPGANASFRVPGLVDRVAMRESSSGVYTGSWIVPANANLGGAKVLGELSLGADTKLIQANIPVNVDTTAPRITSVMPEERSRVPGNRLSVSAVIDDGSGSGIRAQDIVLRIDGSDVTDDANVTSTFVTWHPSATMRPGVHTATVTATDLAGNRVQRTWEFTLSDATTAIQSFTHDATRRMEPGDVITATLKGEKDATITFAIGAKKGIPMRETSDGVYVGEYVVRRGDLFANAPVVASMKTAAGDTYKVEADRKVNAAVVTNDSLSITSPKDGIAVASPLVIQGLAAPNARIRIKGDYGTTTVGGLRFTGALWEGEVTADSQGYWRTPGIALRIPISGSDTTYKFTANVVVNDEATGPNPVVITLKKK